MKGLKQYRSINLLVGVYPALEGLGARENEKPRGWRLHDGGGAEG
jgi:hypothetical protein